MYVNVFQQECLRLFGGDDVDLDANTKFLIRKHHNVIGSVVMNTVDGKRITIGQRIHDLFLYNSACITYNNKLKDQPPLTNEEISLIGLDIIGRVIRYPKFYYTLINYNLPDKAFIKDEILSELLIMFDLSIDDLKLDNFLYYEDYSWKLRGHRSLYNVFKLVNYLDLIVYDANEQISNCLVINNRISNNLYE